VFFCAKPKNAGGMLHLTLCHRCDFRRMWGDV